MSEEPPYYGDCIFVCEVCRETFIPTADEAKALAELEQAFGLDPDKCSLRCAGCQANRIQ